MSSALGGGAGWGCRCAAGSMLQGPSSAQVATPRLAGSPCGAPPLVTHVHACIATPPTNSPPHLLARTLSQRTSSRSPSRIWSRSPPSSSEERIVPCGRPLLPGPADKPRPGLLPPAGITSCLHPAPVARVRVVCFQMQLMNTTITASGLGSSLCMRVSLPSPHPPPHPTSHTHPPTHPRHLTPVESRFCVLFGHRVLGALIVPDWEALQEVASSSGAPVAWLVSAFAGEGGGWEEGERQRKSV